MTQIEKELLENIKNNKIENVHMKFEGKENLVTFDVINEKYVELNERLTLENPSKDFLVELTKIARSKKK